MSRLLQLDIDTYVMNMWPKNIYMLTLTIKSDKKPNETIILTPSEHLMLKRDHFLLISQTECMRQVHDKS